MLRTAAAANFSSTGLQAKEISARSLRAGGAMALLCGNVDSDIIKLLGRWHSDQMMRYLHAQALPITQRFAELMYNHGTYSFNQDETVPMLTDE